MPWTAEMMQAQKQEVRPDPLRAEARSLGYLKDA